MGVCRVIDKISIASVLVLALAAPAAAQDRSVVADAITELRAAGVDLSGPCGALRITNLVAFRRHYALLHKAGGFRAVLKADGSCLSGEQSNDPEGFATDYLIDPRTGVGYDLLGDAGGANTPQWAGPEDAADMVARNFANFREPFDPSGYLHAPTPVPVPPVVYLPAPAPPAPIFDTAALETAIANLRADVDAHRQEFQAFTAEVHGWKSEAGAFLAKYVLPELATVIATWKLAK
jgi:hypothetical protein